jgi:hypothetical protein
VVLAAASSAIPALFARYGPPSVRASLSPCLAKESAMPALPSHLNRPGRARGGQGPAELAPETHPSRACPTQRCGVPSERIGWVCRVPRVSPWAGMPCPVGALRRPSDSLAWQTGRQRDLGRSAPWRRTTTHLARSAKAHPSQSLLSARRTRSRGTRTRDAPFESLSYTAMRRSFRTHRLGCVAYPGFHPGLVCRAPLGQSGNPLNTHHVA